MFTGIVEARGRVHKISPDTLEIEAGTLARSMRIGGSFAVNGACLTVVKKKAGRLSFNVVPETRRRTDLGRLKAGDSVNLERSLRFGSRVEGHFVLGHVDGLGKVVRVRRGKKGRDFFVTFPKKLGRYLFEKGSVAIDGVSLTLGKVTARGFWIHLVPHTLRNTVLGDYRVGTTVNLEADLLAKLASRL
jgi:riboflavin synthase